MSARVLFVNAPWGRVYCPSMGLGLLKARLVEHGVTCDVRHLHLDWYAYLRAHVGAQAATDAFERGTIDEVFGEWTFAAARFGLDAPDLIRLRDVLLEAAPTPAARARNAKFFDLAELARPFLDAAMETVDWDAYDVVGFTTMFSQLNASLAIAERVRAKTDRPRLIFGGSRCEGELGEGVIEGHEVVDAVFTGKPDRGVVDYVTAVDEGRTPRDVPGTLVRDTAGAIHAGPPEPPANLAELPLPDYDDYFEQCETIGLESHYPRFILVETARGCFWGVKHHCIFCGLLGENPKYTVRPPHQVIEDIDTLSRRHGTNGVMFVDLIMNTRYFKPVFDWMAEDERDFRFFCELKPDIKREHLEILWRAGCWTAQPGIESFDTGILGLIDKGTTSLQNAAFLKTMRDMTMIPSWNFLYGIPGEDPEAYGPMLETMACLTHLHPPKGVTPMGLVRNSPAWWHADKLGLVNMRPAPAYAALFRLPPEQTRKIAYSFTADRADGADPAGYTEEVRRFLAEWGEAEERGHLVFRRHDEADGEIIDTRFNFAPQRRRLTAGEAALYEACHDVRRIDDVVADEETHGLDPDAARAAIEDWCRAGWMLREDGACVALALVRDDQVPWFDVAAIQHDRRMAAMAAE